MQYFFGLICWLFPTNLVIVLIGQFIKNIGGLPGSYVFMALFADCLDHMEWKHDNRVDRTAMSIYNIIALVLLFFLRVEKQLPREQAEIKARHARQQRRTVCATPHPAREQLIIENGKLEIVVSFKLPFERL